MPSGRRRGGTPCMGAPSMAMLPRLGSRKPAIRRSRVVLPQPEGPSRVTKLPPSIERSTPSSTVAVPNSLPTPLIEIDPRLTA
jgi:hypothetical protein